MKLTHKINLLFTGIVICILFGMAVIVLSLSSQNVKKDFREKIRNRAARATYLYGLFKNDTTNLLRLLDANTPATLYNRNISIFDLGLKEIYNFHDQDVTNIQPSQKWMDEAKKDREYFVTIGKREVGVFYFDYLYVMVAAEDNSGRAYLANLQRIFFIYFPIAVIVTLLAGYLFSRSIVKPVKQTIHDVKLITSQNMSQRLYTGNSKDELAQLNEQFNALLKRLEESFAMEKRFISNASHELSTPLTSISSQLEVALLQERDAKEYQKILESVLTDARDLHQLTRNLLEIARAGSNGAISLEKVRIDEILIKAHSEVLRQNPEYKVELAFPELPEDENECMVFGNTHLLQSAFKNIFENGCKYSPDNKCKVAIHFNGVETQVDTTNKSEFLPSEEIEKLFEPFYRGRNAGNQSGVGLGLTLTRRIIALHKGNLSIFSEPVSGTIIRIILPSLKR